MSLRAHDLGLRLSVLPPVDAGLSVADTVALAAASEAAGLDGFWYADERFYRETYSVLAAAAQATSSIRLGPAVTDPYSRHPAMTAAAIATLDELSHGRAALGFAAGIGGFRNLGIELRRPAVAVREGMRVIRELLTGASVTYQGELVSIRDGQLRFPCRPVPIFLAAEGPWMLRLAGEWADAVVIYHAATRETLQPKLELVEAGAMRTDRSAGPAVVARLDVCVAEDAAQALARIKLRIARYLWARFPNLPYLDRHGLELPASLELALASAGPFSGSHDASSFSALAPLIPDALVHPIALAGTPQEVIERLHGLRHLGVGEVMLYPVTLANQSISEALDLLLSAGL